MSRTVWVMVANSTRATVYQAEDNTRLSSLRSFSHEEGHLARRDILSDRKGSNSYRAMPGSDSLEDHTPLKLKEAHVFADQLSDFLEESCLSGACTRVYLIATPAFLGALRHSLQPHTQKVVAAEISKDLTQLRPEQIREYLPPTL